MKNYFAILCCVIFVGVAVVHAEEEENDGKKVNIHRVREEIGRNNEVRRDWEDVQEEKQNRRKDWVELQEEKKEKIITI